MDEPAPTGREIRKLLIIGSDSDAATTAGIERPRARQGDGADRAVVLVLAPREAVDAAWLRSLAARLDGARLVEVSDGSRVSHIGRAALPFDGLRIEFDLADAPQPESAGAPASFVVLFEESVLRHAGETTAAEQIARLDDELRCTREQLRATIRRAEDIERELASSNAEFRSLNDELMTVNGELANRVRELTRATRDLKYLQESTQIATIFLDTGMNVTNFTPAVTDLLRLVETDIGRPLLEIRTMLPIADLRDDIDRVLRTQVTAERKLKAPGNGRQYMVRILPYRGLDDAIAGVVITFIDITAMARAEERQNLLLAELQHRVRNTLGVVRSMARRTAQSATSVEDFTTHFDGRINAFARTQALVTRDPEAGLDLEFVLAEELMAHNAQDGGQVSLQGPPVRLQPRPAETFALAIHELATNAAKYGALSRAGGRVAIRWRVDRDDMNTALVFEWLESGGPAVSPPRRKGFGTEILERTLAFEFKAQTSLVFPPDGFSCTIRIPASHKVFQSLPADGA